MDVELVGGPQDGGTRQVPDGATAVRVPTTPPGTAARYEPDPTRTGVFRYVGDENAPADA